MRFPRGSGVLLHVSSLPSPYGIGDCGPGAHAFCDFLAAAGQTYWEVLPLSSLFGKRGEAAKVPYSPVSAFAGNLLLVSPEALHAAGLLPESPPPSDALAASERAVVDIDAVVSFKRRTLETAWDYGFERRDRAAFLRFEREQRHWLDDYLLFVAIASHVAGSPDAPNIRFSTWDAPWRDRDPGALADVKTRYGREMQKEAFFQFVFHEQWRALKRYANARGVRIVGDLPIYNSRHCCDVWAHRRAFQVHPDGRPKLVGGAPPDHFSPVGQKWNMPLYDWTHSARDGHRWHLERMDRNLALFDVLRIDHFQGMVQGWAIPFEDSDARGGFWLDAPAEALLDALAARRGELPVVVEDLGAITDPTRAVIAKYDLTRMNVLLYAFDSPDSPYRPDRHPENAVCYVGTHDNNTALGWFRDDATDVERQRLGEQLGRPIDEETVHWDLVELCLSTRDDIAILQMQDLLGQGTRHRTNNPLSYVNGTDIALNWSYRITAGQLTAELADKLLALTRRHGR